MYTLILLLGLGCGRKDTAQCSEEQPCGFGEVCVEGTCQSSSCSTSAQCAMEQFCDDGTCVDGCEIDGDCYPGDYCDQESKSCDDAPCTDSHIDCDFKEYCSSTGECVEASGYFCRDCELDSDCGGNGNVCMNWGLERDFCGVSCDTEADCPSGFICIDWQDSNDEFLTRQCATYCWLYIPERPNVPGNPSIDAPECVQELK